jgi:hypothetical protein
MWYQISFAGRLDPYTWLAGTKQAATTMGEYFCSRTYKIFWMKLDLHCQVKAGLAGDDLRTC